MNYNQSIGCTLSRNVCAVTNIPLAGWHLNSNQSVSVCVQLDSCDHNKKNCYQLTLAYKKRTMRNDYEI